METNKKVEAAMNLAKEIEQMETAIANRKAALAGLFDGTNGAVAPTVAAVLDTPKSKHDTSVGDTVRDLLKSKPGEKFKLDTIRAAVPNASALAVRKVLYYLTTSVKGFARDKRARGVYYFKG